MDYRGNSVAKFSGGFADPLLKFRWIIRRTGAGKRRPGWETGEDGDNEDEDGGLQTSYLLYLTGDAVFLKGLTMRDGGPSPPRQPPLPVLKKMFNAAESKAR
ncbi:hypothetical protein KM043_016678 [Ampulex compressa]|nr:hypothetical protein KM043_016678 [Ampulex compressa]